MNRLSPQTIYDVIVRSLASPALVSRLQASSANEDVGHCMMSTPINGAQ